MKTTLLIAALLFSQISMASEKTQTVKCFFTEPFFTIEIDLEKKLAVMTRPLFDGTETNELWKGVKLVPRSQDPLYPVFTVIDYHMAPVMVLKMNFEGSNGMSDTVYPIEGNFNGHVGGCETDRIKGLLPF